jgi:hypothetical protein
LRIGVSAVLAVTQGIQELKKAVGNLMKKTLVITLFTVAATVSVGGAAPPPREKSMDAPRHGRHPPNIPNMPEAALSPSSADVGDGDSFGRAVNFLGYAQTNGVLVWWDCTDQLPGTCVVPDAETSTGGIQKIGDEAVIRLPGRSARSLLCFVINPFGFAFFNNTSTTRQLATYSMGARWRIESEVLNDPALINHGTGLPFNGFIENGSSLDSEQFTIEPGAQRNIQVFFTRTCNAGHLTRSGLVDMGLTEAQARDVFRKPITLRFGASINVSWGNASMNPGFRVFGD